MNKDTLKGALWGAFCADAYALGPHWEYNTKNIEAAVLNRKSFNDPIAKYHKGKKAGDFTPYGDQMLWLLQFISQNKSFDAVDYGKYWFSRMSSYSGYIDHASETTLENMKAGLDPLKCGSDSTELSAVSRIAPLLILYGDDPEVLKEKVFEFVKITHNSAPVLQAADFVCELIPMLLAGKELTESLTAAAENSSELIRNWVIEGMKSSRKKSSLVIKKFGPACDTSHVFPGVIHLITKYQDNYPMAMEENAFSGGDGAARGLLAGMILGIINGEKSIPGEWIKGINAYDEISRILDQFPF